MQDVSVVVGTRGVAVSYHAHASLVPASHKRINADFFIKSAAWLLGVLGSVDAGSWNWNLLQQ